MSVLANEVPFVSVLGVALIFTLLMIARRSKHFTVVYGSIAMVAWFALAGMQLMVYPDTHFIGYLWGAIGIIVEVTSIVLTLIMMKADREAAEMQL